MRRIGKTTSGNYIIEATPGEWRDYLAQQDTSLQASVELREYRRATRKSQQTLADELGISRNYVSLIERGKADNISLAIYQRILDTVNKKHSQPGG